MFKKEIRKLYLQKRLALSAEETEKLNVKIKKQFEEFLPPLVQLVHIYLPIRSKNEIDTWPFIHELWKRNIETAVPVMTGNILSFTSLVLNRETITAENSFGIPEPLPGRQVNEKAIDAVVIPMLACDQKGNRVGYGKGMYDAFLPTLRKDALKIGLSFFHPLDKIEDTSDIDIPLDYCICPDRIFKF
jgi:5-formyltetrahydrofolate cyclo-ligase